MYSYGPRHMAEQKQDDQLCKDTRCSPEDLPETMKDREKWRERVRDIRASGTTWWLWWWMFLGKAWTLTFYPISYNISSSSSCHALSTDIPDPLLPPLPIVHHLQLVLRATPRIFTKLLYVSSSRSPCFCSAMLRGP